MSTITSKTTLKIEGMDCGHCATGIERQLKKIGVTDINVDFSSSSARFTTQNAIALPRIISEIEKLGYRVLTQANQGQRSRLSLESKFLICLTLSLPLLLHMFISFHLFHNQWFQLILTTPVFLIGFVHFGRSALGSLRAGALNMDVLIVIGTTAAFIYSLYGTLLELGPNYLFYETSASIITIVLFGNVLEKRSVKKTSSAIEELSKIQAQNARKIINTDGKESISTIDSRDVTIGDILLVNTGDRVPTDGIVIWGSGLIDESMVSGESSPVQKEIQSKVIGATILVEGSIKMRATEIGESTVISQIINMVRDAQSQKPQIQKIGDKVSSVFVPAVLLIASLTFLLSYFVFNLGLQAAMLQSIAVLVIACPCAMGLATPTAVMVGVGRAVRNGILIRGGSTLEKLASVKTVVFDKTGTLTTGKFKITNKQALGVNEDYLFSVILGLETHSSHPLAKSLIAELSNYNAIDMQEIKEEKGFGIHAKDSEGSSLSVGSFHLASKYTTDNSHSIYVIKNQSLIGWIDLQDEPENGAQTLIEELRLLGIESVMLSGDSEAKCKLIADKIGINQIYSQKTPAEKLSIIQELQKINPLAFVGDGINDAPALARADVGISLGNATEVAIQSAQVVLLGGKIDHLLNAILISKRTFSVIKQNLFWAFIYNILAIPIAAFGLLTPSFAAFAMAFSDIIVIANSLRLRTLKIKHQDS